MIEAKGFTDIGLVYLALMIDRMPITESPLYLP